MALSLPRPRRGDANASSVAGGCCGFGLVGQLDGVPPKALESSLLVRGHKFIAPDPQKKKERLK